LSFVKAVCKESDPPTADELRHAFHLAGNSFVGQLKELFIVLDDDEAKRPSTAGGKSKAEKTAKAGKRRASGGTPTETKKRLPATQ
jgi:hypothetical protein